MIKILILNYEQDSSCVINMIIVIIIIIIIIIIIEIIIKAIWNHNKTKISDNNIYQIEM